MVYSPVYTEPPFTDFASISPETALETLNLNWRERDLPERVRTKHVHRLHPYLGKFIPQLVEIFLRKYGPSAVCDPFCGSGTTLVEANALGINSVGCDISPFNCLLTKTKLAQYDIGELEKEIQDIVQRVNFRFRPGLFAEDFADSDNAYLQAWFAPRARKQLLYFAELIHGYKYQDLLKVILSRSARSARLTTHFDLDFPKHPQIEPYYCYKHGHTCHPTDDALQFINRYCFDTLRRIQEFARIRTDADFTIICGDARDAEFPPVDMVITSPPYVGLINYHEQHRYAYELLGLPRRDSLEIGAALNGNSERAKKQYMAAVEAVLRTVASALTQSGLMVIIVNDRFRLYDGLADKLGFSLETELERHVNRRTGRRADDFFESVLVWRRRT